MSGNYAYEVIARPDEAAGKRSDCCQHRVIRPLCGKCAGLSENEIRTWRRYRTNERPILRIGPKQYRNVLISGSDGVLVSRPSNTIPNWVISDWYECLECGRIAEIPGINDLLTNCPDCDGAVIPVAEPFQTTQFSPLIGAGARPEAYAGAEPIPKTLSEEAAQLQDLFSDPNSRFQEGGTGYLRILLGAPRKTRADAPAWLDRREDFFKTFKARRAVRAEQIFREFYIDDKTDTQIAGALGWKKDSVKKERGDLIRRGNRFFGALANEPPP
jgi:hypothetical protein